MKKLKLIYKYGRLYDKETKKRIIINDETCLSIELPKDATLDEDPKLGKPGAIKGDYDLAKEVFDKFYKDKDNTSYWRILRAGNSLYFEIGIKDEVTSKKKDEMVFRLTLLEDLYLKKKGGKKLGDLYDCQCVIDTCYGDFPYFEKLFANH